MITLEDMVQLQSITPEGRQVLAAIGAARASFIVYALPRNAGKSTLTEAILQAAPPGTPVETFFGTAREVEELAARPPGYVLVPEIGHRGRPGYLVGEEVVRAFDLVSRGWSLASSLHADSVEEAFAVLARQGVGDATGAIRYLAKVQALGDPNQPDTRRVVAAVHEVHGLRGGKPETTLRYRWAGASI